MHRRRPRWPPGPTRSLALMTLMKLMALLGPLVCSAAAAAGPAADAFVASAPTRELAERIVAQGDHRSRPFAIVDKRAASMTVFRADGRLHGSTPVIVGRDPGDTSTPGVGERTQTGRLRPGDATTAAGRFASMPGRNHDGEAIVWVDHDAALAIHRLRPGTLQRDRARRLAAADPRRRRASSGCVVVPVAFYLRHVEPTLGRGPGTVYVLPESPGPRVRLPSEDSVPWLWAQASP